MRTLFAYAALLFYTVFQIYGIDPIEFEVINRFPNGRGEGEFRYHIIEGGGLNPISPEVLTYVDGEFFIGDNVNNRMIRIGRNQDWEVLYTKYIPDIYLIEQSGILFGFGGAGLYSVYNINNEQLIKHGQIDSDNFGFFSDTVIAGDMILVNTSPEYGSETPQYFGFHITEDFDGTISMMNPEETIRFLKEDYQGTEKFTVDDEGYIFWNGKLVAPYGDSFSSYHWGSKNPPENWQKRADQGRFVGWDQDDNSYWSLGNSVVVISNAGEKVAEFIGENLNGWELSQFAVTPEGTLYCLSYNADRDEFELMKLDRFW